MTAIGPTPARPECEEDIGDVCQGIAFALMAEVGLGLLIGVMVALYVLGGPG